MGFGFHLSTVESTSNFKQSSLDIRLFFFFFLFASKHFLIQMHFGRNKITLLPSSSPTLHSIHSPPRVFTYGQQTCAVKEETSGPINQSCLLCPSKSWPSSSRLSSRLPYTSPCQRILKHEAPPHPQTFFPRLLITFKTKMQKKKLVSSVSLHLISQNIW